MERGNERWKGGVGRNKHTMSLKWVNINVMNILGHISHEAIKTENCYCKHKEATSNEGWCTEREGERKEEKRKTEAYPQSVQCLRTGSCSGVLPAHAVEGLGEDLRGHAVLVLQDQTLLQSHGHSSAVLRTFTAGKTHSVQSPTNLSVEGENIVLKSTTNLHLLQFSIQVSFQMEISKDTWQFSFVLKSSQKLLF